MASRHAFFGTSVLNQMARLVLEGTGRRGYEETTERRKGGGRIASSNRTELGMDANLRAFRLQRRSEWQNGKQRNANALTRR